MLDLKKISGNPVPLCTVLTICLISVFIFFNRSAHADNDPYTDPDLTDDTSVTTEAPPVTEETSVSETQVSTEEPPVTDITSETTENTGEPPPLLPSIELNVYEAYLKTGEGLQLKASVINSPVENPVIGFYSSDTSVVRVDNSGYIISVGEGRAEVTAYFGNISATAAIIVTKPPVLPEYIVIAQDSFTLKTGATAQIQAELLPKEIAADYPLSFSSGNTEVASVDENGLITALKEGEAYITVSGGNLSETVHVTVSSDIEYDTARLDGYLYGTDGKPMSGSHIMIGDLTVITDNRGYFAFEKVEQRELTLKLSDDKDAVCDISVTGDMTVYLLYEKGSLTRLSSYDELAGRLPISSVSFDTRFKNIILSVGQVDLLTYQYEPKDAVITEIKYSSSNTIVAQVGQIDGVITAKSPGEAVITVSLNGGQAEAVCTVTVNPEESTEHSVLIVIIESLVFAALITFIVLKYKKYRRTAETDLDDTDEEEELHDID